MRGNPTAPIQTILTLWAICEMARGVREKNLFLLSSLFSSILTFFFLLFFLIFSLRPILFLFLLISALCFAILLLDEFGLFPCLRPPVFLRQEISTKARQRNERLSVFYHSANLLVIVIMTSISCKCCIVIMLLQLVLVYMCY